MVDRFLTKTATWVLVSLLVLGVHLPTRSDQALYLYDDLGRLVTVVDGTGALVVYQYDAVGNLLAIERFTPASTGTGVFLVTPAQGAVGTAVTLRGFGFSATTGSNQVAFNGTAAPVVSATATTLGVTVPSGATAGPVTVTNANGTATSAQPFTVLTPTITRVDPSRVAQGSTNFTVLTGTNLDGASAVIFAQSGLTATVQLVPRPTAQQVALMLRVAPTVPPGSYPFTVTTTNGVVSSGLVTVTVAPAVPDFSVGTGVSVFLPFPPAAGPTGPGFSPADVSVFLPFPSPGGPQGPSMGVAPPVSVSTPP